MSSLPGARVENFKIRVVSLGIIAAMTKAERKKAVQFTRMCKFWKTDECKMGTDCTFAHTTEELRPSQKPCFDWVKKGNCSRGVACRFVHDLNSIKPKAKIMQVQYATLENFQPCAVPSQVLATYMRPSQSPMNVEGWLEPQYAYAQTAWPMRSEDLSSSYTPPGLDQIPLPASLVDDPELMAEKLLVLEYHTLLQLTIIMAYNITMMVMLITIRVLVTVPMIRTIAIKPLLIVMR